MGVDIVRWGVHTLQETKLDSMLCVLDSLISIFVYVPTIEMRKCSLRIFKSLTKWQSHHSYKVFRQKKVKIKLQYRTASYKEKMKSNVLNI